METLAGDSRECTELFETNCCVDEIPENSFANSFFAAEVSIGPPFISRAFRYAA